MKTIPISLQHLEKIIDNAKKELASNPKFCEMVEIRQDEHSTYAMLMSSDIEYQDDIILTIADNAETIIR